MTALSAVVAVGINTLYAEQERAHVALQAAMAEASREARKVLRAHLERANLAANLVITNWRMDWGDPADRPHSVELLRQSSHLLQETFPEIVQIAIVRPDGFSYPEDHSPNANFTAPVYMGDREHFKAVASAGVRVHFGNRIVGRLSGLQTLQYAVAARDGQGALQMVVVVSIRAGVIPQVMLAAAGGDVGLAVLTWPDGRLVDSTVLGSNEVNVGLPELFDLYSDQFKGWFISRKSPLDGVEHYMHVSYIGSQGLFLAMGVDQKIIHEQKYKLNRSVFIIFTKLIIRILFLISIIFIIFYLWILYFGEKKLSRDLINFSYFFMKFYDLNKDFVFFNILNTEIFYLNKYLSNFLNIKTQNFSDCNNYAKFNDIFRKNNPEIFDCLDQMAVGSQMQDVILNIEVEGRQITIKFDITKLNIEHKNDDGSEGLVGYFGYSHDYTASLEDRAELSRLRLDLANVVRTGPGAPYRGYLSDDDIFMIEFPSGLGPLQPIFTRLGADLADPLGAMKIGRPTARTQFIKDLRANGQARARFPLVDANGQVIWIQDKCVTIERSGNDLTVAGYYDDVTKLIDTELALEQAAQMARLGAITGGLSHELNQPLAAISMAAENGQMILEDGAAGMAEATEKFSRIAGFAQRAATIVRDMRHFASLEGVAVAPTPLKSVIDSAILIMAAKIGAANLDVTVAVDVAVMPVSATYGLLEQVLVNLIANAVDAHSAVPRSAEKPGWIAIRAEVLANDFVGLTVADNAGGFPPEIASRMFDPFFTTKGPAGGTGLGLSVSFGILKSWGGSMGARNANGGAIFDMTLPVWKAPHPQRISANF